MRPFFLGTLNLNRESCLRPGDLWNDCVPWQPAASHLPRLPTCPLACADSVARSCPLLDHPEAVQDSLETCGCSCPRVGMRHVPGGPAPLLSVFQEAEKQCRVWPSKMLTHTPSQVRKKALFRDQTQQNREQPSSWMTTPPWFSAFSHLSL